MIFFSIYMSLNLAFTDVQSRTKYVNGSLAYQHSQPEIFLPQFGDNWHVIVLMMITCGRKMLNIYMVNWFNSSPPGAAYMRRWTWSALVQVSAWRLFGAKHLPEPMLTYYQLDSLEQTSVKFVSKYRNIHLKCIWKRRLRNGGYFAQGEMSY